MLMSQTLHFGLQLDGLGIPCSSTIDAHVLGHFPFHSHSTYFFISLRVLPFLGDLYSKKVSLGLPVTKIGHCGELVCV